MQEYDEEIFRGGIEREEDQTSGVNNEFIVNNETPCFGALRINSNLPKIQHLKYVTKTLYAYSDIMTLNANGNRFPSITYFEELIPDDLMTPGAQRRPEFDQFFQILT